MQKKHMYFLLFLPTLLFSGTNKQHLPSLYDISDIWVSNCHALLGWKDTLKLVQPLRLTSKTMKKKFDPHAQKIPYACLFWAASHGSANIIKLLLSQAKNIDVNRPDPADNHRTALHKAILSNNIACVKALLQHPKVDVNAHDTKVEKVIYGCNWESSDSEEEENTQKMYLKTTPFHYAVCNGNIDIALLLLKHGAHVKTPSSNLETIAEYYSQLGKEPTLLKSILDVYPNFVQKYGEKILIFSAAHLPTIKLFLRHGFNANTTIRNHTLLHEAIYRGNAQVISFLIKEGAQVNAKDTHGRTPLDYAIYYKNEEIKKTLIQYGGQPSTFFDTY